MRIATSRILVVFLAISGFSAVGGGNGKEEECTDSRSQAETAATDLAHYARRLQRCAESLDFSDDCSLEFRKVKNAQGEYESAVADVGSLCE